MPDYAEMYGHTFRSDTKIILALENLVARMKTIQQQTEEMYLNAEDPIEAEAQHSVAE